MHYLEKKNTDKFLLDIASISLVFSDGFDAFLSN